MKTLLRRRLAAFHLLCGLAVAGPAAAAPGTPWPARFAAGPWAGPVAVPLESTVRVAKERAPLADGVLRQLDTAAPLKGQDWRVLCDGEQINLQALPEGGIVGDSADGRSKVLKFGKAPSPSGDGAPVLLFRAQPNNVAVGGAPRCELVTNQPAQALPRGQVFWSVFSLWIDDWSDQDDMMAVTQWFHGMPGADLNPPFVLIAAGKRMWADVRHNASSKAVLSKGDLLASKVFELRDGGFYRRWLNFAIQARLTSRPGDGGFMKIYLDGKLLGEYNGPIGYSVEGSHEYLRHGIYPLVKKRAFDKDKPVRELYLRQSVVLSDPDMKLRPEDMAAYFRK